MRASLSASPRVAALAAPTLSSSRAVAPVVVVAAPPRSLAPSLRRSPLVVATRASSTGSAAAPAAVNKPPPPSAKSPRMSEVRRLSCLQKTKKETECALGKRAEGRKKEPVIALRRRHDSSSRKPKVANLAFPLFHLKKKLPSLPLPLLNGRLSSQPAEPADPEAAWAKARSLQAEGTPVSVVVTAVNKGGVVVALPVGEGEGAGGAAAAASASASLRGFIPTSKLDPSRVPAGAGSSPPRSLVGTSIAAKVVQVDAAGRKLILSERAASLASLAGAIGAGDVLTGVVTRLADYGAFVSLQSPGDGGLHGAEGLIHLSELSWDAVLTPEAVVQPGTVVRVRVLGADADKGRIRLSLKRMEADPLTETLDALLPLGAGGDDAERVASPAAASTSSSSSDAPAPYDPALVPTSIEGVCDALRAEPGVDAVKLGRQAEEKRAVSQDLELWISRAVVAVRVFFSRFFRNLFFSPPPFLVLLPPPSKKREKKPQKFRKLNKL